MRTRTRMKTRMKTREKEREAERKTDRESAQERPKSIQEPPKSSQELPGTYQNHKKSTPQDLPFANAEICTKSQGVRSNLQIILCFTVLPKMRVAGVEARTQILRSRGGMSQAICRFLSVPVRTPKPVLAREREARYGETASCMRSVTRRGEEENTGRSRTERKKKDERRRHEGER